jgi:hypothetical protein
MKSKTTLLVMVASALVQVAAAADQPTGQPAAQLLNQLSASKSVQPHSTTGSTTVTKTKPLFNTPLNKFQAVQNYTITRAGNISSRSWTGMVGWNPGTPSFAFESGGGREEGLTLFWIGHEPWR